MSKRYDTILMMLLSTSALADKGFTMNQHFDFATKIVKINGVPTIVQINATSSGKYGLKIGTNRIIYKNNLYALLTMLDRRKI